MAMDDTLRDLPGVVSIADDIAIFGSTEQLARQKPATSNGTRSPEKSRVQSEQVSNQAKRDPFLWKHLLKCRHQT